MVLVKELLGHKDDSSAHYYAGYTHDREMASGTYECAADDTSDSDNGSVSADTVSSDDVNVGVKCCDGDTVIDAEEQTVRAPVVRFASCGTGSNDHGDVVIVSAKRTIETQTNGLLAKRAVSGSRQDFAAVVGIYKCTRVAYGVAGVATWRIAQGCVNATNGLVTITGRIHCKRWRLRLCVCSGCVSNERLHCMLRMPV